MLLPNTGKNLQRNRFPGDYKDSKREMQWEQAGELHDVPAAFDFMAFLTDWNKNRSCGRFDFIFCLTLVYVYL